MNVKCCECEKVMEGGCDVYDDMTEKAYCLDCAAELEAKFECLRED